MYAKLLTLAAIAGGTILFSKPGNAFFEDDDTSEKEVHTKPKAIVPDAQIMLDDPYQNYAEIKPPYENIPHSEWEEETDIEAEIEEPNAEPTITLRRGDRFTCPETGQALQVRAVGGRPKKNT